MNERSYVAVALAKPMGIVFEENDAEFGGIFVQSLKEGGVAAINGVLQAGDQLVSVGSNPVSGLPFDDALAAILDTSMDKEVKLVLFRGGSTQFYGPTGPSKAWLTDFCAKGGVEVTAPSS
jgi:S1-C subfamily serine protease